MVRMKRVLLSCEVSGAEIVDLSAKIVASVVEGGSASKFVPAESVFDVTGTAFEF